MHSRIVTAILCLFTFGCSSGYEVYDVAEMSGRQTKNLLYYSLPRQVVNVEIPVTKVETVAPALCADDSFRTLLLIVNDDVLPTATKYQLGDAVITSYSEPDPKAVYAIGFDRAPLHKLNHIFELTEGGLLSTGKSSLENQSAELTASVLKGVAGIAGAAIKAGGAATDPADRERAEQDARKAACEKLALSISTLRSERDRLLVRDRQGMGESKDTLEYALAQLALREKEMLAHFIGTKTKTTATVQCRVTPSSAASSPLFRFASDGGVSEEVANCVVPPDAIGKAPGKSSPVTLNVALDPPDQFATKVESVRKKLTAKEGLFYRIPASTLAKVTWEGPIDKEGKPGRDQLKGQVRMAIAQLGVVNALPGGKDARSFKYNYQAILYPASGALQKLDLTSESGGTAAAGTVTAASDGAATVLNAINARELAQVEANKAAATARKAEETAAAAEEKLANDELLNLERQRKILEERKKILDLQKDIDSGGN